jgi:hypothetical protein
MQYRSLAFCAFVLAVAAPLTPGHAQQQNQQTGEVRNCESGGTRRQFSGQPMTDFMKLCQASRVNPENLGKICNDAADNLHLSGTARETYLAECTRGAD